MKFFAAALITAVGVAAQQATNAPGMPTNPPQGQGWNNGGNTAGAGAAGAAGAAGPSSMPAPGAVAQTTMPMPGAVTSAAPSSGLSGPCQAEYIVTRCLETEQAKVNSCSPVDWKCLCAAYQAVSTCYNNCPEDPRAGGARAQVEPACMNASLMSTMSTASSTSSMSWTMSTPSSSSGDDSTDMPTNTANFGSDEPTSTNAAVASSGNAGGLLLAVMGAVAALL